MVSGLKIAWKIGRAKALAPWRAAEALPGPGADTDDALRHYADQTMGSYFHPVGTCRMGVDDMSVVDCELRVHGISGLRIADGSTCRRSFLATPTRRCTPSPSVPRP